MTKSVSAYAEKGARGFVRFNKESDGEGEETINEDLSIDEVFKTKEKALAKAKEIFRHPKGIM